MDNKPVSLSVIVPMYNAAATIESCLEPLLVMQERGEVEEIIVVDDGSTDASAAIVRAMPVRILKTPAQQGPGGARNLAAKSAKGSALWFVDSDVVARRDAAGRIVTGFKDASVAAVFGSYDENPRAGNFLSQYKNLVHRYYHQRGATQASTFWAGCGAVRRNIFLELGGFDTIQFPYPSIEDIELGQRIVHSGAGIRLLPDLQAMHLKEWRFVNLVHTEIFRRAIPWSRLMLANGRLTDDLNVSVGERLRALVAGLFVLGVLAAAAGWLNAVAIPVLIIALAIANHELLVFFARQRGLLFAVGALAYHQIYYLYSMAAFAYVWAERRLDTRAQIAR